MRRSKAAIGIVAAVVAGAAWTAPARADQAGGTLCSPLMGRALLAGSAGLPTGIAGRGGAVREPDLGQTVTDLPASAKGKAKANFRATVPVYVHVITAGAVGNLTSTQIANQIAVLNDNFGGSGFSFRLAGVDRTDNATWFYAGPGGNPEKSMKAALHKGGPDALNFYSTTAGDFLGWAYLPDIVTKPGQAFLDGIVIDWESIPGTSSTYL